MARPLEPFIRTDDDVGTGARLILRGSPSHLRAMMSQASIMGKKYTLGGQPIFGVSADLTGPEWTVDRLLGERLNTREFWWEADPAILDAAGFKVLPTFKAPHATIVLPEYDAAVVTNLISLLGEPHENEYWIGEETDNGS